MEREEARVSTRRRSTHNGDSLSGLVGPITQSVVAKKAVLLPKKSFGGSPSLRFQESVLRRHSMAGSSSNEDPRERAAASSSASAVLSRGASRGVSRSGLAALVSTVDLGDPRWREALQTPDSMVPLLMSTLSIAPAGQTDRIISLPGTMNRRVTIKSSSGSSSAETERSTAAESAITHVERASLGIMGRQNHHEVLPRLRPARNSEETGCSASMSIPDGSPTAKAFSNSIPTSSLGKQLESQSSNQFNVRQRLSTGLVSSVQAATESSATMSSAFTPWQSAAVSVVPVGGRVSKLMPSPPEYPSRFQRSISHTRSSHISDLNEVRFNRVRMPPVPRFTNCLSPTRASQEREREGGMLLAGRQHSPTRRDTLSRNQAASSIVEVEDQAGNQKKGGGKLAVSSIGVASPAVGSTNSASTSASRLNTPGGGTASHAGSGKWTVSALQWFSLMKKTEHMDINGGTWKDASVEVWGALSAMSTASSTAAAKDDEESSNTGVLNLNRAPSDHLANLLANVGEWQFDIFALEEATSGHALSVLGFALITRTEAWRRYSMDEDKLARFLMEIENGYTEKYYHCAAHGADVLRSLHVICTAGRIFQDIRCSEIGILAMYLSAVIHDYEHLGLSNDFLIKTQSELAIRYNDRAPMENHHVAASWLLLRQDRFNFMSEMPTKAKEFLRNLVIEAVLATDMKQHFSLTSLFSSKVEAMTSAAAAAAVVPAGSPPGTPIQQPRPLTASRLNRSVGVAGSPVSPGGLGVRSGVHTHAAPLKPQNEALNWDEDSKILVMQMALKSADVGNLGSTLPVHSRWIEKLEVEMFRQGDQERALGLPISPLMDRTSGKGVTKAQAGFFKFVAMPLYQAMAQAFPGTQPLLAAVKTNHAHWAEQERVEAEGPRTSAPA
ncbi:hypothetical protein CEUSTIGMA_g6839.t1 [Chlamydomonas eustigma]|uniref:Phosphodiesterase n=1 Tax=Chlamydomonas eustigma TaxID=1157962 RepID=A0A250X8I9_9CHLO|nr:hypothetical protein CEUSTIGMA_g6839.t1 [Chlamydomonas eustigma]|eukprot:GAX79398.1 hypothetical protein CEUSTIGMA_g6839.t1 [Chlamydomonas eustigma]